MLQSTMSPARTRLAGSSKARSSRSPTRTWTRTWWPRNSTSSHWPRNLASPSPGGAPTRMCSGRMPTVTWGAIEPGAGTGEALRSRQRERARPQDRAVAVPLEGHLDQVHRRAADEARHEDVGGMLVQGARRTGLLEHSSVHDRHPGAHRECLGLVVRHGDDRGPQLPVESTELGPGLEALAGVQVRERVVEQEDGGRVAHDRAPDRRRAGLRRPRARAASARAGDPAPSTRRRPTRGAGSRRRACGGCGARSRGSPGPPGADTGRSPRRPWPRCARPAERR